MDKFKVQEATKDLKVFFEKRNIKISEVKEVMFRLIDYIDEHFDEDSREAIFKNGNGINTNNYKDKIPLKGIKLEVKAR